jgi:hypothetical protein
LLNSTCNSQHSSFEITGIQSSEITVENDSDFFASVEILLQIQCLWEIAKSALKFQKINSLIHTKNGAVMKHMKRGLFQSNYRLFSAKYCEQMTWVLAECI